jgi:hypothetical protein
VVVQATAETTAARAGTSRRTLSIRASYWWGSEYESSCL